MPKFAVISGFLGAGKTTVMMALTKHDPAAAMISNDLGEGVELADHRFAKLSGCAASQITDECICFCHDRLLQELEEFFSLKLLYSGDDLLEAVLDGVPMQLD